LRSNSVTSAAYQYGKGRKMHASGDPNSKGVECYDTAAALWPQLLHKAGLTGASRKDRGPYDSELLDALSAALFPGQIGDFGQLIGASTLTAEDLLRAFFATLQPFAEMKTDILAMLADARAQASGDSLRIRFNFTDGDAPLDLLLEDFGSQMERFAQVLIPTLPLIEIAKLWSLCRAGFEDEPRIRAARPKPQRLSKVIDWLADYRNGGPFSPLPGGWETGDTQTDVRLGRIVRLMNALLARFVLYGPTHAALEHAARAAGGEERDGACYSVRELWFIESDYWPAAITEWILKVNDVFVDGDQALLSQIHRQVDTVLPESEGVDQVTNLLSILEDIVDLPVWKHRYEVYAVWLGAQIHRTLTDDGWHFRFHLVNSRLEFAFRGVHLATLRRAEHEPELYWWTELRTNHFDLPNTRRTSGIQPDYRILRSPLSAPDRDVLVLEAKQHLQSSNKEFKEAVEDYAHACPRAGVLLVNYGPCSANLMTMIAPEARTHSAAYGKVHPGNPQAVEALREDMVRVVKTVLAGCLASAFQQPCEITLTWGADTADLDLHLLRNQENYLAY